MSVQFRSQAGQDQFVHGIAIVGEGCRNGTFLDIGCQDPVLNNNSYVLEQEGWSGLLVDRDPTLLSSIQKQRRSPYLCADAKDIDWSIELPKHGFSLPCVIDYLSFDLDDDGLSVLTTFPLFQVRFRLLTIEHDAYRLGDEVRQQMRRLLHDHGYDLLCPDVECSGRDFEDWWVDPARVNMDVANRLRTTQSTSYLEIISRL